MKPWHIPIVGEKYFDTAPVISTNRTFVMPNEILRLLNENTKVRLQMFTNNSTTDFTIKLVYDPLTVNVKTGTLLAALILSIFYALLLWEVD